MSQLTLNEALAPKVFVRIKEKIEVQSSGCWLWKGQIKTVKEWRYPIMVVANQVRYIKALVWIIKHQTLPPKGGVSSSCGVDLCVAPDHMVSKYETYNVAENGRNSYV